MGEESPPCLWGMGNFEIERDRGRTNNEFKKIEERKGEKREDIERELRLGKVRERNATGSGYLEKFRRERESVRNSEL